MRGKGKKSKTKKGTKWSKQMSNFQQKVEEKLKQYRETYRVDELNEANDLSTLMMLIRQEVLTEDWYEQLSALTDEDAVGKANSIKKLMDTIRDSSNTIINLQKTLNIDRKTRKTEEANSPADFIRALKRNGHEFMKKRIIPTYCPDCKIMVGRIYPVHDHTAFSVSFQCNQCNKMVRARREEKDIFFDVKDHQWRRKHRAEIVQPKKGFSGDENDDDLVLGDSMLLEDSAVDIIIPGIEEELELDNVTS